MSTQVNVSEARAQLPDLLARAGNGEEIIIAEAGRPVARIVAVCEPAKRGFPSYAEYDIPDDILLRTMPKEEFAL